MKQSLWRKAITLLSATTICVCLLVGFPVTTQAADEAGIRAFVTRMYETCLNREPEDAGLSYWSNRLASGEASGSDIAFGFVFSEEFRNMNLCNEHYVDSMYKAFFGREADATGKAYWLDALGSGKTRGYVMTGFVNSEEFYNLCAACGIVQGTGDWSADDIATNGSCVVCESGVSHEVTEGMRSFVERLYTNCLGRDADEAGLESWAQALADGMTGSEVAAGFVFSEEYTLKDASDVQYVMMLYATMLGREPDSREVTYWVLQIRENESREIAFNGFLGSEEFGNLCSAAGIVVGGEIADNGTTGRASTGELVTVAQFNLVKDDSGMIIGVSSSYTPTGFDIQTAGGLYGYGYFFEGEIVDFTEYISEDAINFFAAAYNTHPVTEPFVAYDGASGWHAYLPFDYDWRDHIPAEWNGTIHTPSGSNLLTCSNLLDTNLNNRITKYSADGVPTTYAGGYPGRGGTLIDYTMVNYTVD